MNAKYVGARVERREDQALLTGNGQYTDDIEVPNALVAVFVRAQVAHARIRRVDSAAARTLPGVHGIWTFADLPESFDRPMPLQVPNPMIRQAKTFYALAKDEVTYVGEPIAVILADTRHIGEDASDRVVVDYEPLPISSDCRVAAEPGAPLAHLNSPNNVIADTNLAYGDIEAAFARADLRIQETFWQHRGLCHAMEGRAVQAVFDSTSDQLNVWSATQAPHMVKNMLVEMLMHDDAKIRVIAPDVGGGFGPKAMVYQEELLVPLLAILTGRPIRWTEDRREHFVATTQERDQHWDVEAATDSQGRILGVRGTLIHDSGAYAPWGIILPYISGSTMPGPYRIPAYRLRIVPVFTNKTPTTPLRGAGRPQAVFAMERLMDRIADALGLDRAEVRRRNFVQTEEMPYSVGLTYRDGAPMTYDSGNYPECQQQALKRIDYDGFRDRQAVARAEGRYIGIGIGNYVEGTGLGPYEGAILRVLPSGRISIASGAAPQGQGHVTTLAQIAADAFGMPIDDVEVTLADTGIIPIGIGTFASRITVNAGSSVHIAAMALKERILKLAAHLMEASVNDLEIQNRIVQVKGVPGHGISLARLRTIANGMPGFTMPEGLEPGLEVTNYFTPRGATYCNGTHVVEVEVDPGTGGVTILRYVVAHDSGKLINPLIVDGQIQGGVAHGIGNALLESMRYDNDAQPQTMTLAEYLLPMAPNVPDVEIIHLETPSPLNPLGVKGAGEGGTIPTAAAIVAAIESALTPFGVKLAEAPVTPERIAMLVEASEQRHRVE